ncbi:MAG TPA: aldolase/citrate lyase family protein [Streptosporangiaceae bacterium]
MSEPAGRLGDDDYARLDRQLEDVDSQLATRYPGTAGGRQPVHTVYVPADRCHPGLAGEWGAQALAVLAEHGPSAAELADGLGLPADLMAQLYGRVRGKLEREPIEDLRIDFEDGYGHRSDGEEDADALSAAGALAAAGHATPFSGIRFKSLEAATRRRGVRTLDLFLGALLGHGGLPDGFVVTLPKVSSAGQVGAMAGLCERLEQAHGIEPGRLRFELQIETPQAVLGADGTATVAQMIHASRGRCSALHYGTYDYSAAVGVAAAYQSMDHPAADHAKAVMQVAAAGTGVQLSDGSANVLPVGDRQQVLAAWRLHLRLVRRSLERGYYQGWDMHPGQLVTRYTGTYGFFRDGLAVAAARLRAYAGKTGSDVLDEPATAQALAGFLVRGLDCGALDGAETYALTGLDRADLDRYYLRRTA